MIDLKGGVTESWKRGRDLSSMDSFLKCFQRPRLGQLKPRASVIPTCVAGTGHMGHCQHHHPSARHISRKLNQKWRAARTQTKYIYRVALHVAAWPLRHNTCLCHPNASGHFVIWNTSSNLLFFCKIFLFIFISFLIGFILKYYLTPN